jgi:enoyl-CoA hydratase
MIDLKTEDGIAVVTLAHGKASALDIELCEALTRCFEELRAPEIRAVVLTGQGRIFSAGVDLVRLSSGGTDYVRKFLPVMNRAFDAVFFLPKPLVAALNGHAIAGGCVLACCADRRLMARGGGRIGVTELLVGVPFPAPRLRDRACRRSVTSFRRVHVRRRDLRGRRRLGAGLGRRNR